MKKNSLYNTSSISLFQYLFAIAVILVHSGRLTSYESVHFGLKSILGRLAVPFFIVCASFFLKPSLRDARKMKAYLVKIVKTYLFWSCVYLPYAWVFFSSLHLPVYLFPAGVLIALLYLGMCYQLWYIPAFLLGLFLVNQLVKRLGMVWTGVITFLLYCWGLIETYSAYLDTTSLLKGYSSTAIYFLQLEMVSFTRPFLSLWVTISMIIFMHKPLGFTVGKSYLSPLACSVWKASSFFNMKESIRTFSYYFLL